MQKAEEQEEHWRSVVRSKDEQINTLQYKSNGQQVGSFFTFPVNTNKCFFFLNKCFFFFLQDI